MDVVGSSFVDYKDYRNNRYNPHVSVPAILRYIEKVPSLGMVQKYAGNQLVARVAGKMYKNKVLNNAI